MRRRWTSGDSSPKVEVEEKYQRGDGVPPHGLHSGCADFRPQLHAFENEWDQGFVGLFGQHQLFNDGRRLVSVGTEHNDDYITVLELKN